MLWVDRWKLHAYIPPGIEFSYCLQSVNQEFLQWSGRIPIWDTKRNQRVETKPSNRLYSVQQNTINGTFISAEIMCMWGVCVCVCVDLCTHWAVATHWPLRISSEIPGIFYPHFGLGLLHLLLSSWNTSSLNIPLVAFRSLLKCYLLEIPSMNILDKQSPESFSFSLSSFIFLHIVYHNLMIQWYLFIHPLGPPLPLHTHMLEC